MEIAHSGMTVFTSRPHLKTMPRFNMLPFFLCPGGSKSGVACLIPAHLKASALFCVCLFQATDKCLPPWSFPCPSPLTSRLTGCFSLAETLVGFAHKAADVRCFKHRSTWGWKECHKEMIVKIPVFQARLFLFPFFFFFPCSGPCKTSIPFLPHPVCFCAALVLDITASLMTQSRSSQREMLKWECHDQLTTNATIIHR